MSPLRDGLASECRRLPRGRLTAIGRSGLLGSVAELAFYRRRLLEE